jgi:SAM-dependent MidA family methyltransferase
VEGYFSARSHVVGSLHQPLDFKTMLGKSGYEFKIRELYRSTGSSWLTPVEIFQPHYGEGIARYIVADFQKRRGVSGSKLRICEVGAGNGTLAANVLDYVSRKHPDLYQDMEYTALEVSKPLSKKYVVEKMPWHHQGYCPILSDQEKEC